MRDVDAELLARIRKLLTRAAAGDGAEAASAASLAAVLMRQHGIRREDVELTDAPHVHAAVERPERRRAPRRTPIRGRVKFGAFDIRFEL